MNFLANTLLRRIAVDSGDLHFLQSRYGLFTRHIFGFQTNHYRRQIQSQSIARSGVAIPRNHFSDCPFLLAQGLHSKGRAVGVPCCVVRGARFITAVSFVESQSCVVTFPYSRC